MQRECRVGGYFVRWIVMRLSWFPHKNWNVSSVHWHIFSTENPEPNLQSLLWLLQIWAIIIFIDLPHAVLETPCTRSKPAQLGSYYNLTLLPTSIHIPNWTAVLPVSFSAKQTKVTHGRKQEEISNGHLKAFSRSQGDFSTKVSEILNSVQWTECLSVTSQNSHVEILILLWW